MCCCCMDVGSVLGMGAWKDRRACSRSVFSALLAGQWEKGEREVQETGRL
jgi:hypothetical protein